MADKIREQRRIENNAFFERMAQYEEIEISRRQLSQIRKQTRLLRQIANQ
jgi:DNA-binding LytR/AlgR family response regulator